MSRIKVFSKGQSLYKSGLVSFLILSITGYLVGFKATNSERCDGGSMSDCLQLVLQTSQKSFQVGQAIHVTEVIKNIGTKDIYIDGGTLNVSYAVTDVAGSSIPEEAVLDRMTPLAGRDSFWKLGPGESRSYEHDLKILLSKEASSSGRNWVLEVNRTAGRSRYTLPEVPGNYSLVKKWYVDKSHLDRAKEFGFKSAFSGELLSNKVSFKVINE